MKTKTFDENYLYMRFNEIYSNIILCDSWQEKYRLLIQLSRQLPEVTEQQLAIWQEIHGCESRLWVYCQQNPFQIKAYSDARLMRGLLVIVIAYLEECSIEQLQQFDIKTLLNQLKIDIYLTNTKLYGLQQIEKIIKENMNNS